MTRSLARCFHNPVARALGSFYNPTVMVHKVWSRGIASVCGLLGSVAVSPPLCAVESAVEIGTETGPDTALETALETESPPTDSALSSGPSRAIAGDRGNSPERRRGGFTGGASLGMLVANGRGYPNVGEKIGDPAFETITGMAFSSGGAVWLGVAVADWLSVSFGVLGGSFRKSGRDASLAAFQFRMEAFPLYSLGGAWRDVGVLASSGVGQFQVENAGDQLVDGGGASAVGLGAFYEPIRWAGFAMGPQFEYTAQFAENLSAYALILGWRTAFYADP